MNEKLMLAKAVTKFIAGRSVGMVVINALKAHVPTKTRNEEIQLMIGALVLGGMITDRAVDWTGEKFDDTLEFVQALKSFKKEVSTTE